MNNPCAGCEQNCCKNIMFSNEPWHPEEVERTLGQYPFIHKTGERVVGLSNGVKVKIGVYNCDHFDVATQLCGIHDSPDRPFFCGDAGEEGVEPPSIDKCILFKKRRERWQAEQ